MIPKIDKNGKEYIDYDEIFSSSFFLKCDEIFLNVFHRMRLLWMLEKPDKKHTEWFTQIYGPEMFKDFFLHLNEQREEYKNKIRKSLDKDNSLSTRQKEKIIKEITKNDIKRYDESINKNLNGIKRKYGEKIKNRKNKVFYNIILEITCPSFLRKEYSLYSDV